MLVKKIVTYTQKAFFSILCNAVIKLILSIIYLNSLACRLFLQSVR